MACPYFFPIERMTEELWPHRRRLPLGDGWRGGCTAAPNAALSIDDLRDRCNLGYASSCPRLPAEREADAVRFSVACDRDGLIQVCFVLERAHEPLAHGRLLYALASESWIEPHADARVQRMAECYLESYRARRR
jgi:hypothetical protein